MAIENSIAGVPAPESKLLGLHGQKIIGEVYVHIEHCLLANPGVRIEDLTEVESHPDGDTTMRKFLFTIS